MSVSIEYRLDCFCIGTGYGWYWISVGIEYILLLNISYHCTVILLVLNVCWYRISTVLTLKVCWYRISVGTEYLLVVHSCTGVEYLLEVNIFWLWISAIFHSNAKKLLLKGTVAQYFLTQSFFFRDLLYCIRAYISRLNGFNLFLYPGSHTEILRVPLL
jgi:hypothetical protein